MRVGVVQATREAGGPRGIQDPSRSRKVGFCIAPTDSIDLLIPHATWQPATGFGGGACGLPTALWVQEALADRVKLRAIGAR